jgi:hypothetical protein
VREPAVAVLGPGIGQQDQQPVLHRDQPLPVFLGAVDLLQVAQHAREDVARRRRLQVQAQRHLELVDQAAAPLVRLQPLRQLLARQRLAGERDRSPPGPWQVDLHHEVPGEADAARMQPMPCASSIHSTASEIWMQRRVPQHDVEVAVVRIAVVVDVCRRS